MDIDEIPAVIAGLDADLWAVATPERAANEKRYLKSDLDFIGVTVPEIRKVRNAFARDNKDIGHDVLIALVEGLWAEPVHERRMLAVQFLNRYSDRLEASDLPLVERLIRESKTWALVDELAAYIVEGLVRRHPQLAPRMDRWAADEDFWIRRSALLMHLNPLRHGGGDWERFTRYADAMLDEKEFFIRKAIGWVLREVSKSRPELVIEWLGPRTDRASGVTMREATKYLPAEARDTLMAAYKEHRPAG